MGQICSDINESGTVRPVGTPAGNGHFSPVTPVLSQRLNPQLPCPQHASDDVPPPVVQKAADKVVVRAWNVFERNKCTKARADVATHGDPDIIALQEVIEDWERPDCMKGYTCVRRFNVEKTEEEKNAERPEHGCGIWLRQNSDWKAQSSKHIRLIHKPAGGRDDKTCIVATFKHEKSGRVLTVATAHLFGGGPNDPAGIEYSRKNSKQPRQEQVEQILSALPIHTPSLFIGDFNSWPLEETWNADTKGYMESSGFQEEEFKAYITAGHKELLDRGFEAPYVLKDLQDRGGTSMYKTCPDWAYSRGARITHWNVADIKMGQKEDDLSDHKPLSVVVEVPDPPKKTAKPKAEALDISNVELEYHDPSPNDQNTATSLATKTVEPIVEEPTPKAEPIVEEPTPNDKS